MKASQSAALLVSAVGLAAAQYPSGEVLLKFYENSPCSGTGSASTTSQLLPSTNDDCISGIADLGWPTVSSMTNVYKAYVDASDIPAGCSVAVLQQANIAPGSCGTAIDVIKAGTGTSCLSTKLPEKGGFAMCCGGVGNGCSLVPGATKRSLPKRAPAGAAADAKAVRDVTEVKRAPILDRLHKRSCAFTASGSPFQSRGAQQIVTDGVSCPAGSSNACSIANSASITKGSSNTFGASESTTVGTDELFVDIQESVSFSYSYTYSTSTTQSQTYSVAVPAGESGYVTWTPTVSCVSGSFPASCGLPNESGTACIPLYISGDSGDALGMFAFLQEQ